jgi:pSer/pThr/pTyr-binding forkhead associated (FHA) protein
MPTLTIEATASGGRTAVFAFRQSPVTIGSGALGDLVLAFPFVSQCHALLHFDERGARYVDLGSRNGSVVAGAAAAANSPVPVGPDTDIVLGPLRLRVRVEETEPAGEEDEPTEERAFFTEAETPAAKASAPPETTSLPAGFSADAFLASLRAPVAPPAEPARAPRPLTRHLTMVLSELAARASVPAPPDFVPSPPAYEAPVATMTPSLEQPGGYGHTKVLPTAYGQQAPDPAAAYASLAGQTRHLGAPVLATSPTAPPAEPVRNRLSALLERLPADEDRALVVALVALAEHAAESFVALRNARKTVGDELGVRVIQQSTPIHAARSAEELLAHLLERPAEATGRARQLTRATSELLMVHELAFLAALREGVSDLVDRLDPNGPEFKARRRGMFGLREYQSFFEEETEDPWRLVLGHRFAVSYAAATNAERAPVETAPAAPRPTLERRPPLVKTTPRIVFLSGPLAGREVGLLADELTLGRAEDNSVVLDDPSVSRRHAVIGRQDEGWIVADAGSKNGITVNEAAVPSAVLKDGDLVEVGDVKFRFASGPTT